MTKDVAKAIITRLGRTRFWHLSKDNKQICFEIIDACPNNNKIKEWLKFLLLKTKIGLSFGEEKLPSINSKNYFFKEKRNRFLNIPSKAHNAENTLIIGDNYTCVTKLIDSHINKIDIIYIDPPYNNKAWSIKKDKHHKKIGYYTNKFSQNKWLSMMKKLLGIAKILLKNDGIIFVSIDNYEIAYLKLLMDEIFGANNFIANFDWISKPGGQTGKQYVSTTKQYILMYAKTKLFKIQKKLIAIDKNKIYGKDQNGEYIKSTELNYPSGKDGKFAWQRINLSFHVLYNPTTKEIKFQPSWSKNTNKYLPPTLIDNFYIASPKHKNLCWRWSAKAIIKRKKELIFEIDNRHHTFRIFKKKYIHNLTKTTFIKDDLIRNITQAQGTLELNEIFNGKSKFPYPKPAILIAELISLHKNKEAVVMDFFAGSGTTAHGVLMQNKNDLGKRKFILCTNNENKIGYQICYERLHRIITGKTSKNFDCKWAKKHLPFFGTKLQVMQVQKKRNP